MAMFRTALRRFWSDTSAAVAMETLIITPLLVWAYVGSFVFFDAYRVYNTSVKATYMAADLISRQTSMIDSDDIDGLAAVVRHIVRDLDSVEMRVTQVFRTPTGHAVDWSYATGGQARLFNATLAAYEDRLPVMVTGERQIIVETFLDYRPAFNMGLNDIEFENFTITRPRYAGQIPFDDGTTNGSGSGNGGSEDRS